MVRLRSRRSLDRDVVPNQVDARFCKLEKLKGLAPRAGRFPAGEGAHSVNPRAGSAPDDNVRDLFGRQILL